MRTIQQMAACVAVLVVMVTSAQAAPVTFSFSGTVIQINFSNGTPTEFAIGDTFSGTYTFDSTTPDSNTSPNLGDYYTPLTPLSATVGSYSASANSGAILIRDNVPVEDYYFLQTNSLTGPTVLGLPVTFFGLELHDSTGTVYNNDSLLLLPPDLQDYDSNALYFLFDDPGSGNSGTVHATLDSFVLGALLVPEPSCFAMFGIGAGVMALVVTRRQRRKKLKTISG